MERKSRMKTAAFLMAIAMMISGTTVSAAGTNYSTTTPIATESGFATVSIDKYLVMDQDATVPNATFIYKIESVTGQSVTSMVNGEAKTTEVLTGVGAENIIVSAGDAVYTNDVVTNTTTAGTKWYQLKFNSTDETNEKSTVATTGYAGSDTSYDAKTQKYAKKTLTLDFTKCGFTEPGIYRYKLTECDSSNQGITNDTENVRYIDVYVEDATDATTGEKKLKIAGYAVYTTNSSTIVGTTNATDTSVKSGSFTNTYDTSNLTFRKEVTGNQASRDKYFKFTVTIATTVKDTEYKVDISSADDTVPSNLATKDEYETKTNVTTLKASTLDTDSSSQYYNKYYVTQDFYLQHGQEITIKGLAKDTVWTIVEDPEDDYTSTANGVTGYTDGTPATADYSTTVKAKAISDTIASADEKTSYLNTRSGTIPTGIILTIAPFAAAVLIGGAGLIAIMVKKNRRRED